MKHQIEPLNQLQEIAATFAATVPVATPDTDYWSLRLVDEASEGLAVRDDVAEPSSLGLSRGGMITVVVGAGIGYGATNDLSRSGLVAAFERARGFAALHDRLGLFDARQYPRSALRAEFRSAVAQPWESWTLQDKLAC